VPLHEIEGAALGFVEDAAEILADDAERHQLHAAEEQHHGQQAGIAGDRVAEHQRAYDQLQRVEGREDRGGETQIGRDLQRPHGEAGDALQAEVPELPVVPLRRAGRARRTVIQHRDGREADPGKQPLHEAVLLAQRQQRIDGAAAHQPEIAGVRRQLHLAADALHQAVEGRGGRLLGPGFAFPHATLGIGDVVALAPGGDEIGDDLGRVLEVGVDHHHRLRARRVVESGGQRDLLAEVPAEIEHADMRIFRLQFEHEGEGGIAGAVIDEDDFPGEADAVHDRREARMEGPQHFLLIIGRHDDGDRRRSLGRRGGPEAGGGQAVHEGVILPACGAAGAESRQHEGRRPDRQSPPI